ncbi:MAG TPA: phage tail protein, partial [Ilumatobacteraceae bacterium]|nr:phage tail protein [Ilumatobacteraceae bacterium]
MPWRTFTPSGQEKVAQQGIATVPIGTMVAFGGTAAPSGWLFCDGSNVSRTTYADLFAAIGVTWGPGDGSTTFKLPDLRGRSLLGAGVGSG